MNSDSMKIAIALVGRDALYTGGELAAQVKVLDWKLAYGRVDLKVRDACGFERWVQAESVQAVTVSE